MKPKDECPKCHTKNVSIKRRYSVKGQSTFVSIVVNCHQCRKNFELEPKFIGSTNKLSVYDQLKAGGFNISTRQELAGKRKNRQSRQRNPGWHEGYYEFLKGPVWREFSSREKKDKCCICGERHFLVVHHLRYDRGWTNPLWVVTVCKNCHEKIHNKCKTSGMSIRRVTEVMMNGAS